MAIKISIVTTLTNPEERGDNWKDALDNYIDLADEVVIVSGSYMNTHLEPYLFKPQEASVVNVYQEWPREFFWSLIGRQMQRGYSAATGDWVIRADLDMIFHENDFATLRKALQDHNYDPAVSLYKRQFILPDRFNVKSRLVCAMNKGKYGDRIELNAGGDLCQPSLDGKELKVGTVPDVGVPIYNYEKIKKNERQIKDDVGRMARAWKRHFGGYKLGGPNDDDAYKEWLTMVKGRFLKPQEFIPLDAHPKYVKDTINSLHPDMWGYSGFGELEINRYVA